MFSKDWSIVYIIYGSWYEVGKFGIGLSISIFIVFLGCGLINCMYCVIGIFNFVI